MEQFLATSYQQMNLPRIPICCHPDLLALVLMLVAGGSFAVWVHERNRAPPKMAHGALDHL